MIQYEMNYPSFSSGTVTEICVKTIMKMIAAGLLIPGPKMPKVCDKETVPADIKWAMDDYFRKEKMDEERKNATQSEDEKRSPREELFADIIRRILRGESSEEK